ncbi:MAG: 50S ribosomal protein L4 [Thermoguttaceae bacterium]
MVSLPINNIEGVQVGTFELDLDVIAPKISKQLLHEAVVMYQANLRQGSAKSKTRAEVAGAKKKMYRQKGTGNARAGHRRSGVRRGGGHIFAKQPRNWYYRMPRKSLQIATKMAFVSKVKDNAFTLVDELNFAAPKTKIVATALQKMKLGGTMLLAVHANDRNAYESARNIAGMRVLQVSDLNAYEILRPRRLIMTKSALEQFVEPKNDAVNDAAEE